MVLRYTFHELVELLDKPSDLQDSQYSDRKIEYGTHIFAAKVERLRPRQVHWQSRPGVKVI